MNILDQTGFDQAERLLLVPTASNLDAVCGLLRSAVAAGVADRASLRRIAALLESAREARESHWRLRLGRPGYTAGGIHPADSPTGRVAVEA